MNNIESNRSIGFKPILKVGNTRILRPYEAKQLINAIPKEEQRDKFEALLYSGMRYVECKRLLENPQWFDGEHIHLSKSAIKKDKIKFKERYVHLNPIGRRIIKAYLKCESSLPSYAVWTENLKRWASIGNIEPDLLSPKTTRKTWEGFLVTYYPHLTNHIFLSQGHSQLTALQHYVNLPFDSNDKLEMREFVEGWE